MADSREKDPRFRNLERKVGIFIIISIIGLLGVLVLIGKEKDLFTKSYSIYFKVESGAGIMEGMSVKLSGFKIGRVKSMSLDDNAAVMVSLDINRKYQKWIRGGSVAKLTKEGMIGESVIELNVGGPDKPVIEPGKEIPFEKTGGMEELTKEAKPILTKVNDVLTYINDPDGEIKKILRNVETVTREINQTRRHLDDVIIEARGAVKDARGVITGINGIEEKASAAIDKLNPVFGHLTTIASELEKTSKKIPPLTDKVDAILTDTKKMTGSLDGVGPKVTGVVDNIGDVVSSTDEAIAGVKGSWPLKNMIPKREEMPFAPLDGAVR